MKFMASAYSVLTKMNGISPWHSFFISQKNGSTAQILHCMSSSVGMKSIGSMYSTAVYDLPKYSFVSLMLIPSELDSR